MQDEVQTGRKWVPRVCTISHIDFGIYTDEWISNLVTCIPISLLIGRFMVFWYEDDSSYLIIIFVFISITSLFNTLFNLQMIILYYSLIHDYFIRSVGSILGIVIGSIFGIIVLVVIIVVVCSQIKTRGVRGTVVNPINVSTVQHSSSQHQQRKSWNHISIFKVVQHLDYIFMYKFAEL